MDNKKQHKYLNRAHRMIRMVFLTSILLGLVVNILVPDRDTSDMENRSLAKFPAISLKTVSNGDFFKGMESWFADQFVGRNTLIKLNYMNQKAAGIREINNVYLGKNMLIEKAAEPNKEQLDRNIKGINDFAKRHPELKIRFVLAPNAISIEKNKLPGSAPTRDQNKDIDNVYKSLNNTIETIDLREAMNEYKDEYIYYKTDHHWTSLGAFYAAQQMESKVNKDDYDIMPVTDDFQGTLSSKSGNSTLHDRIDIYVHKDDIRYMVTHGSDGSETLSMYNSDALKQKDKYQVFLGGNEGMINISIDNDSDRRLLLIKDSYANELIQFLLPYYRTITIIDPRYYFDDLERQMNRDIITDVLFMYNTNTFLEDTSLADCLAEQEKQEEQKNEEEEVVE